MKEYTTYVTSYLIGWYGFPVKKTPGTWFAFAKVFRGSACGGMVFTELFSEHSEHSFRFISNQICYGDTRTLTWVTIPCFRVQLIPRWTRDTFVKFVLITSGALTGEVTGCKRNILVNSLWPSDTIRRQRSRSTLAQVMACCLTAPSHYLNQCWLIISEVQWHSYWGNFTRDASTINH